jgi:leucyl aminopeptidase
MDFKVKKVAADKQRTSCIVVGVYDSRRLGDSAQALNERSKGQLLRLLRGYEMRGGVGETVMLNNVPGIEAQRVLVVGCGKRGSMPSTRFRRLSAAAMGTLVDSGTKDATICLTDLPVDDRDIYWKARQVVEALYDVSYRFDQLKSEPAAKRRTLAHIVIATASAREIARSEEGVKHGEAISAGVELARDLGNLPGNICTPGYLAESARKLARGRKAMSVRVKGEAEMKRMGMGALLSVSRGSQEPAKLITLEYRPQRAGNRPIVLVGKGVTFDSGGISIKPAAAMDEMKFDMCGAASVLGAMKTVSMLGLNLNVVGIIPATENLSGGAASKPGDIFTSMSGQTIEVLNTDAEGRLILCDALTHAERMKPDVVVDIATLTGACVVALGSQAAGLFSNHDGLAQALLDAGESSGDRAWRLPLWEEYGEALKSNFADVANVGGRDAGAITAASFLSRFAGKYHWAHLDIAGVAWRSGKSKGATGRPVRLLSQYLLDRAGRRRVS